MCFFSAPPKFDVAHAGPVTGRTGETLELVCEAAGDDHIKWVAEPTLGFQNQGGREGPGGGGG